MIGYKHAREDVTFIFVTALSKSQFRVNYSNHTFQTAVPQLALRAWADRLSIYAD